MSGKTPIRDTKKDWLLTPDNCAIAFIDYQPDQYKGVHSIGHEELLHNVSILGLVATSYNLPVVLTTVFVKHGMGATNKELLDALPGVVEIDRTTMNSWEDEEFNAAIKNTGRKKLIFAGLWTEICVAFPVIDALQEGYDVYFVADAIGGVSNAAHEAAMQRMIQAGAKPISVIGFAGELQRDWGRGESAEKLRHILRTYFAGMAQINKK